MEKRLFKDNWRNRVFFVQKQERVLDSLTLSALDKILLSSARSNTGHPGSGEKNEKRLPCLKSPSVAQKSTGS